MIKGKKKRKFEKCKKCRKIKLNEISKKMKNWLMKKKKSKFENSTNYGNSKKKNENEKKWKSCQMV